jgi:hypothetical protein
MPPEAAIGQVFTQYCPGGRDGHQFGVVKLLSEASIQKAPKGPSNQLIKQQAVWKV